MQRLRKAMAQKWNGNVPSQEFRDAFRAKSLPMMKYTNMLSFSTRSYVLFISIFTNMPWIYFAFEIVVLGIMYLYMISTHERFCKKFTAELEDGKY